MFQKLAKTTGFYYSFYCAQENSFFNFYVENYIRYDAPVKINNGTKFICQ